MPAKRDKFGGILRSPMIPARDHRATRSICALRVGRSAEKRQNLARSKMRGFLRSRLPRSQFLPGRYYLLVQKLPVEIKHPNLRISQAHREVEAILLIIDNSVEIVS